MAAIDIGTNSLLMLVAERASGGGLVTLADELRVTRLGRGVDRAGRLEPAAVQRTLEALDELTELARRLGAVPHAVGTSALRDARNADAFLEPAADLLDGPVRILSGPDEARLTFQGAGVGLDVDPDALRTVVDIGGGSTEIVVGRDGRIEAMVSLDIGCVRMTERHGLDAPASRASLLALDRDLQRGLERCGVQPAGALIGIAGSVTTLSAIVLQMAHYDPTRIHGSRLTRQQVAQVGERLAGLDGAALATVVGLPADRAEVAVAGARILGGIMAWAGAEELVVSNGGIRVGLAASVLPQF